MPTDQNQLIHEYNTLLLDNKLDVRKRLTDLRACLRIQFACAFRVIFRQKISRTDLA